MFSIYPTDIIIAICGGRPDICFNMSFKIFDFSIYNHLSPSFMFVETLLSYVVNISVCYVSIVYI